MSLYWKHRSVIEDIYDIHIHEGYRDEPFIRIKRTNIQPYFSEYNIVCFNSEYERTNYFYTEQAVELITWLNNNQYSKYQLANIVDIGGVITFESEYDMAFFLLRWPTPPEMR